VRCDQQLPALLQQVGEHGSGCQWIVKQPPGGLGRRLAPLAAFAASPGLALAIGLLIVAGLGNAWTAGIDGLLIDTAPSAMRNHALALAGAGIMFTQGAGFALWGIAGQYLPLTVVIPMAAAAGAIAAAMLRPQRSRRPASSRRVPSPIAS